MLDSIFLISLWIVFAISLAFLPTPIGNENSNVRRVPWVTFGIMAINVIVFYVTLPSTAQQGRAWMKSKEALVRLVKDHQEMLADGAVRSSLEETGVISKREANEVQRQLSHDVELEKEYRHWLRGAEAANLRKEFQARIMEYKAAAEASIWYKYGLTPNGNWKAYQLITAAFLHGDTLHLFGNLIFFFAVAFSLEDLWGRAVFLAFYLLAAGAACIPELVSPGALPSIGASGAISATMGAFLIRLYKTKIKIAWLSLPLAIPLLVVGRKPYGLANLPAYIFLPFYFIGQLLYWWFYHKYELASGVGYSAHVAGFVFGACFALVMKASKAEEKYIHPKIEAKVSFEASPAVTQALRHLDRGDVAMAERKLKSHLVKRPDDVNALMALIQVYQRTNDLGQLNFTYGRLIHHHLENNDKEAAIYAYDGLLSSFPDNHLDVRIPARDWIGLCEYLRQSGMDREAAVEYERLTTAHPIDPLSLRACVQGGEAALAANDNERALRLFERGQGMAPPAPLAARISEGIQKCRFRMDGRSNWPQQAAKPEALPNDI